MVSLSAFSLNVSNYKIECFKNFSESIQINYQPKIHNKIIEEALTHIGKPYKWATRGPKTFDCSGFVYYVFKQLDIILSPGSRHLFTLGEHVSKSEAKPCDLIFFTGPKSGKKVGHVGIVYDNDGEQLSFIHASSSGVRISKLSDGYYTKRFVGIKRVI